MFNQSVWMLKKWDDRRSNAGWHVDIEKKKTVSLVAFARATMTWTMYVMFDTRGCLVTHVTVQRTQHGAMRCL